MSHVDALSRNAISNIVNAEEIKEIGIFHLEHDDLLLLAQIKDEKLKRIKDVLKILATDTEEKRIHAE